MLESQSAEILGLGHAMAHSVHHFSHTEAGGEVAQDLLDFGVVRQNGRSEKLLTGNWLAKRSL
jgi:hypothetical protein